MAAHTSGKVSSRPIDIFLEIECRAGGRISCLPVRVCQRPVTGDDALTLLGVRAVKQHNVARWH